MRDFSCLAVSFIINAFEKSANFPFHYSMFKGIFPDIWKEANVFSLLKKDDPSSISNYRPISLLNKIGKIIEKMSINICLISF